MIQLLKIQPEALPLIKKWAAREDLAEFFRRFPPVFSWPAGAGDWFSSSHFIAEDDKVIGLLNLSNFDSQSKKVELGIMIDPALQPKRHEPCREACLQIGDYVFNYLGYEKIYSLVLEHRTDLVKFMQSEGYQCEGLLRSNVFWRGKHHNEIMCSILKKDFKYGR